ncbi:hypothetical protein GQ54DRAFT_264374 [Martensiomyces pterosporus]|nr:hypothetical protein GQ54DRAFT_264374 [Martensiomyces pterosporus]
MVNFIRAGELIDANLAEEMRSALIRCGWMCDVDGKPPYNRCTQQDANELYLFLMEKLQMPYLPMEVRMVHGADHDDADNRMVTQRVLELSFPDDGSDSTDGSKPLLLQAMLETYFFDNRVEHLERILKSRLSGGEEKSTKVHTNAWSFLSMYPFYTPQNELGDITAAKLAAEYPEGAPLILPLLIKRYSVDSRGAVHRTRRRVIIPMVLDVTNIISTGDEGLRGFEDEKAGGSSAGGSESAARGKQPVATNRRQSTGGANSSLPPPYPSRIQYRLVLRSAICHKGTTTSSGHYISFCTRLRLARPGEVRKPLHTHLPKPGDGSHAAASTSGKAESDPVSDLLVPNSISKPRLPPRDAFRSRRRHSWPEPPPYVQSEPGPGDGAAPTIGEFLRFDDMDISHSRMQYFSTSEGGRQCMDEISRDGYMLFYALQRRAIDAIMRSSGAAAAQSSTGDPAGFVLADYRDDGQAFEDMAMRWQNIRLSELASPVGPLDASDRPSPFARTRSKAQLKERGQGADRHGDRRSRASKKPHSHHNSEQCTVM